MKSYCGVDISKHLLDIYFEGQYKRLKNNDDGFEELIELVKESKQDILILCEASGGNEKPMILRMNRVGILTHVAQANKIRAFARAKGYLAKTDKLDAEIIAEYGRVMNPEAQILLTDSSEKIKELLKRRDQLLHDKQAEQQRLDKATPSIKTLINRHIKWLTKEIDILDQELSKIRHTDQVTYESHKRFTSIPGIGDLVAYHIIAYLPELGTANNKQLAALTGVAPFNRDSGSIKGKRYIWGGRKELRRILYMAAISARQWNPDMSVFYNRLRCNGKPGKLALVAVIRKLLCLLNSVEKRKGSWEKVYV